MNHINNSGGGRIPKVPLSLYKRKLLIISISLVSVSLVSLFFILFNEDTHIKKTRNIIWSNHLHESEVIDRVYMKYDHNALDVLDSAFLNQNDNFNESQRTIIKKGITKIREIENFRARFTINNTEGHSHADSPILHEAKEKFEGYDIAENYMYIYMLNFTSREKFLVNIKFNSSWCSSEWNMSGFDHYVEEEILDAMGECIVKDLQNLTGKTIMIGHDKTYTNILPLIFKEYEPEAKLGFVSFDEQLNTFEYEMHNIHNALGKNLAEGKIDKLIFIGVSPNYNNKLDFYFEPDALKTEPLNKIEVYYDTDYDNKYFKARLSESIERMKEDGITNIIFNVNLDVLPEQYTGFEYSIIAPAMSLAKYYKYHDEGLEVQNLGSPDFDDPFFRGLKPEEISDIIRFIRKEADKHDIKVGINIYNSTFIGDIEELLPEQDINFRTSEAAGKIADAMTE